jgi:putative aldouronate transport system permease protein
MVPFLHTLAISLSGQIAIAADRVGLLPSEVTVENYTYIVNNRYFLTSFGISVVRVVLGVISTLLMVVVTAYPLSLDKIKMPGRTVFKIFLIFMMLFSGGLIPTYLAYRSLGLYDSFLALVLPQMTQMFYIIIMINFFRGLPLEILEAALLDGATHLDILFRVFLPLSKPAIATITLFVAVSHWNSWFDGYIYLKMQSSWPLQTYLYNIVTERRWNWQDPAESLRYQQTTPEGLSAALMFVAAVPVLLVYPFLQRYFVHGLTLGSVKG